MTGIEIAIERMQELVTENAALKAELKAINTALDDPRTDLTLTAVEVINSLKEQVAQLQMVPVIEADEYKTWWELALHVGAWKDHELSYVHFGSEMAVRAFAIHLLRQRDKLEATQQETISQQAAVIEQMREALDYLGNNLGEYALAMQTQQQADVLSNYAEAAFQARTLQQASEILEARDEWVAEACAKVVIADNGQCDSHVIASQLVCGEWRKHV